MSKISAVRWHATVVPGRAGQPTQALVHITLTQLRNRRGRL